MAKRNSSTPKKSKEAKPIKRPTSEMFRTTLSLPKSLEPRFKEAAVLNRVPLMQAARHAIERYVEETRIAANIGEDERLARELVQIARNLQNPYQRALATWRLERAKSQLTGINACLLEIDTWSEEAYLLRVLSELFKKLDEFDEFLVVTTDEFWSALSEPRAQPWVKVFLAEQIRAISRGVALCRVFLVAEDRSSDPALLTPHRKFLEAARLVHPDAKRRVKVYIKSYDSATSLPKDPFGFIRRRAKPVTEVPAQEPDECCLFVKPVYESLLDKKRRISHLRFQFSAGPSEEDTEIRFEIGRFLETQAGSFPVDPDRDSSQDI